MSEAFASIAAARVRRNNHRPWRSKPGRPCSDAPEVEAMRKLAVNSMLWGEAYAFTRGKGKWFVTARPPLDMAGQVEIWRHTKGRLNPVRVK